MSRLIIGKQLHQTMKSKRVQTGKMFSKNVTHYLYVSQSDQVDKLITGGRKHSESSQGLDPSHF